MKDMDITIAAGSINTANSSSSACAQWHIIDHCVYSGDDSI